MAYVKKEYNDGLKGQKTATNPKGGGRVKGRVYPNVVTYPGILAEIRMAWSRMKAQAKFRGEEFILTWDEFQAIWEGRWHLRGTYKNSLVLVRKDNEQPWCLDNVEVIVRLEQWRRQNKPRKGQGKKCS